jgi:hypothetical protein
MNKRDLALSQDIPFTLIGLLCSTMNKSLIPKVSQIVGRERDLSLSSLSSPSSLP